MVKFPTPPPNAPTTIPELFDFYHDYVKFFYGYVQAQNWLPSETIFELNNTLDHLSRYWVDNRAVAR
jgi:hypothetical protein